MNIKRRLVYALQVQNKHDRQLAKSIHEASLWAQQTLEAEHAAYHRLQNEQIARLQRDALFQLTNLENRVTKVEHSRLKWLARAVILGYGVTKIMQGGVPKDMAGGVGLAAQVVVLAGCTFVLTARK